MEFTLTEAQQDLSGLTRSVVTELVTNDRLRELDAAEDRFDAILWNALASAGVLGAALPESVGGDGFGVLEQCSILAELGRGVAAVPFLTSIVGSAAAIAEFGSDKQRDEWASAAAAGEKILTAALAEEYNDDPAHPVTRAEKTADGWRIDGAKITVDSAPLADLFLVPAITEDGVAVFLVEPSDAGVSITRQSTTDFSSAGLVEFDSVQIPADRVLGSVAQGSDIAAWIVERIQLGSTAYQYGVLDQALKLTAEYATERVQFGRPIGSFQAVAPAPRRRIHRRQGCPSDSVGCRVASERRTSFRRRCTDGQVLGCRCGTPCRAHCGSRSRRCRSGRGPSGSPLLPRGQASRVPARQRNGSASRARQGTCRSPCLSASHRVEIHDLVRDESMMMQL